jgi:prevent-host-death family protein
MMTMIHNHGFFMNESLPVPAGYFKAHCLALMDQVAQTRKPLTLSKRGKPVAMLVPLPETDHVLYGALRGMVLSADDVVQPVDEPWDADE